MAIDRTTKILLALLVVGVWGLLLRPVFEPVAARAAGDQNLTLRLSAEPITLNVNHTGGGGTQIPLRVQVDK